MLDRPRQYLGTSLVKTGVYDLSGACLAVVREAVKSELELGMGTQFDPKIAEIMLSIVEEDKDYRLRG